jgi:hypothetical protein
MKRFVTLFAVLSLTVAACGGSEGESTTTISADAETTTTAGVETTTTSGETPTTFTAGGGGDECLLGEWLLDDEAFFAAMEAEFASQADFGELTVSDGVFSVTFEADGTVTSVRQDWGFSVASDEGTFNIRVNGDQTGTWETDGSTLSLVLDGGAGLVSETTIEVDGQVVPLPTSPVNVPTDTFSTSSEFSCDNDNLVVMAEGFTSTFVRP